MAVGPDSSAAFDEDGLVLRIQAGDAAAFATVIERYANGALRVAYRLLQSREAAHDVLQNVLSDWWVRRQEIAPVPSLQAYLFAAVRYQSLNELRRQHVQAGRRRDLRHGSNESGATDPDLLAVESETEEIDDRLTVETLLARLPERRRLALQLRYLEQLPYTEIARVMGISLKAAEHLVLRSLEALRGAT